MFKLNNKGWGLGVMILFIGVFCLAILIIAVLSSKYGLMNNSTKNIYNSEKKMTTTKKQKYLEYEQIIGQTCAEYVNKNYKDATETDNIYININELNIKDQIKQECTGYVNVGKVNDIPYYNPYIKCNNYQTEGYEEIYNRSE